MYYMRPLDPQKQEKIIKAVFTITGRQGLAGINMNGISQEAEVGVGSLYTYFNSKEEVIQAAYSVVEHQVTKQIYNRFDIGAPIHTTLKAIYINTLKYRLRHYDATVFIDQYIQSNYVQLNFAKQLSEFEAQNKPLYTLLQKGQADGLIIKQDAFMIISFMNSAVRSLSNGIVQKLIPLKKQVVEDGFEMVWKAITY